MAKISSSLHNVMSFKTYATFKDWNDCLSVCTGDILLMLMYVVNLLYIRCNVETYT